MKTKVLQVFYNENGLPFKDQARTVHFPILGAAFQGASNTTQIRFYYDELVDDEEETTTWVATTKLPNGKIGSKILTSDLDENLNENYVLLELDSFYTQYKGDIFITLQGYDGSVELSYDEDTGLYSISGTPTIAATGSIKLAINYATQFIGSDETSVVNFQRILAELGTKLGIRSTTELVSELPTPGESNVFYTIYDDEDDPNKLNIYIWNATTESYVWVGDNTLDLGDYYTTEQGEQFEEEIDSRVSNVENELSNVASGSPKGVYATLNDLQTAYPTGTNGIYIVLADGHWYYWNGSSWADGGVYLASAADNVLNENSTNAIQNSVVTKQFNRNSANDNENTKGTLSYERVNDYTEYAGYWRSVDNSYIENTFVGTRVIDYEEGYDYFYTGRNLGSANYYGIVYFDSANNVIGGECISSSTQVLYSRYKATIPLGTAKIGFTAIKEGENQPLNGFLLIEKSKHLDLSDENYNNELGFSKKAVSKNAFYHIPMYGQSLSLGSDAPYHNDGTMNGLYMLGSIGASSGDLKPLELTSGEMQPLVPALQDLKKKWDLNGINHNIIATSSGSGGSSIAQLMSATRQAEIKTEQGYDYNIDNESPLPYVKWQNACSSAKVIVKDRFNMNLLCPAIIYLQGERDFLSDQELIDASASRPHAYACGDDKELYKTYMKRLKDDMQAYIMALYGQTIKPYFIIYTCSDIFIRTIKMGIVMAQQEFAEENDDVILLAPHYPMPNYTNGHLTTNGYRWYGEYIGKALGEILIQNKVNRPMRARDFKIEGQVIKVKIDGATLPLKMDTELVQNISQKGFRVYVDGAEGTINSLLFYGDEIMLTVSQNLSTANKIELTYASSGVGGKGNIRDSYRYKGQYAYLDDTNDHGSSGTLTIAYSNLEEGTIYPLYNWLTPFYVKLKG